MTGLAYPFTTTAADIQIASYIPFIEAAPECSTIYVGFFFAASLMD